MKKFKFIIIFIFSLYLSIGCCIHHTKSKQFTKLDLVDHLQKSTVAFVVPENKNYKSYCSGIWINENTILTARHCVIGDVFIKPKKSDHGKILQYHTIDEYDFVVPTTRVSKTYLAVVDKLSLKYDLATLISLNDINHDIVSLSYKDTTIGSSVYLTGHPKMYKYTFLSGEIAAVRFFDLEYLFEEKQKVFHIITHIGPGASGSGAFDENGKLIGICSMADKNIPGNSFYIHLDSVKIFLDENNIKYH